MLFIFLSSNKEEDVLITPQSEAIRINVAKYETIFGEPDIDYKMFIDNNPVGEKYKKMFNIKQLPAVLYVDDVTEEKIYECQGSFPPLKILFTWARSNKTRKVKRQL